MPEASCTGGNVRGSKGMDSNSSLPVGKLFQAACWDNLHPKQDIV
jgi:hypothetical protein